MEKGKTLSVSCSAIGTPPPTVEWSKDGNVLPASQQVGCLTRKHEILKWLFHNCIVVSIPSPGMKWSELANDSVSILYQNELDYNLTRRIFIVISTSSVNGAIIGRNLRVSQDIYDIQNSSRLRLEFVYADTTRLLML